MRLFDPVLFLLLLFLFCCSHKSSWKTSSEKNSLVADSELSLASQSPISTFKNLKYGLHVKYLNAHDEEIPNINVFNNWVDAFDVEAFAEACKQAGAGYVIWPLGRTWFNAPNQKLDSMLSTKRTSNRDLPMELYQALNSKGIKMMLYINGRKGKPTEDPKSATELGYDLSRNWVTKEFTENWQAVISEYSARYGGKVFGWWVDRSLASEGFNETKWARLVSGAKSGNPQSLVTLMAWIKESNLAVGWEALEAPISDFTHGHMFPVDDLTQTKVVPPVSSTTGSKLWHYMYTLGKDWGDPGIRLSNASVIDHLRRVNERGGILTFSVFVYKSPGERLNGVLKDPGNVDPVQLNQLKAIKNAVRTNGLAGQNQSGGPELKYCSVYGACRTVYFYEETSKSACQQSCENLYTGSSPHVTCEWGANQTIRVAPKKVCLVTNPAGTNVKSTSMASRSECVQICRDIVQGGSPRAVCKHDGQVISDEKNRCWARTP